MQCAPRSRKHLMSKMQANSAAQVDARTSIVLCKRQPARAAGCGRYLAYLGRHFVVFLLLVVITIGLAPMPAVAEMTVQEYERLKASNRPDDIASVKQYVRGFFNGLTWASTKSKTEFGFELV